MKKRLLASAIAASLLLSAGVALASPEIKLNGDLLAQQRWNTADGAKSENGGKFTLRLNASAALSAKTDVYARIAAQTLTGSKLVGAADFNTRNDTQDNIATFDRFGFIFKDNNGWSYNLGRQTGFVGGLGLLYSTDGYLGKDMGAFDGLKINGKSGVTNLELFGGKEWKAGDKQGNIYALHASYNPAPAWTLGATLASSDYSGDSLTYYAGDAAYEVGKATFLGEFGKSNASNNNKAFTLGTSYKFDEKNSGYMFYSKVEKSADISGWTDFDPAGKGMYYGWDHKINKETTFSLFYKDMKAIEDGSKYTSFRTTISYKF